MLYYICCHNNNKYNQNNQMLQLIDEKTSKWLKSLLDNDDKRKVAIKHDKSLSYINMIINRDRYNQKIVTELKKVARKKELK